MPDLVDQELDAVIGLGRCGDRALRIVEIDVVPPDPADDGVAAIAAGIRRGGAGGGASVVPEHKLRIVGVFAPGILDAGEAEVRHVLPLLDRRLGRGDLGNGEAGVAGRAVALGSAGPARGRARIGVGQGQRGAEPVAEGRVVARNLRCGRVPVVGGQLGVEEVAVLRRDRLEGHVRIGVRRGEERAEGLDLPRLDAAAAAVAGGRAGIRSRPGSGPTAGRG